MNDKLYTDDINLREIFSVLWKGKYKIILIVSLIVAAIFNNYKNKQVIFTATTEIHPISTNEELKYLELNSYVAVYLKKKENRDGIYKNSKNLELIKGLVSNIDGLYLLDLIAKKLKEKQVIIDVIKKNNLIKKEDYTSTDDYENSVLKLAYSISILSGDNGSYLIKFKTKNKKQWVAFLRSLEIYLNEQISIYLNSVYKKFVENEINLKNYEIEDLNQEILNATNSYKNNIAIRLAFLKEDLEIAKALNIENNTTTIAVSKGTLTSTELSSRYYLRGYQAIKKEIEIISSRTDIKPFVAELGRLEEKKRDLMSDRSIDRLENVISNSINTNSSDFSAGKILIMGTSFKNNKMSLKKSLVLSLLIGFMIAIFYLFIENAIRKLI